MDNDVLEDIDLDEEEEESTQTTEETTEESPPEPTAEEKRLAALENTVAANAKQGEGINQLIELGKQFLANQNKPPAAPDTRDADIEAFGKRLKDTILTGTDSDLAKLFVDATDKISTNRVTEALTKVGNPLAEKSGSFAVREFLAEKKDALGPAAEKTHALIAKEFQLTPQERAWVATASSQDAQAFLEQKYEQVAGKVLIRSAKTAKPKNIDGGSGGGKGGGGGAIAGLTGRDARKMQQLAEIYWPDPKVREAKLKAVAAGITAGG